MSDIRTNEQITAAAILDGPHGYFLEAEAVDASERVLTALAAAGRFVGNTPTGDMAKLLTEARAYLAPQKWPPLVGMLTRLIAALEASEAARANLEAVIAEARAAFDSSESMGARGWQAYLALERAGDPVVLREHDAKVREEVIDWARDQMQHGERDAPRLVQGMYRQFDLMVGDDE